MKSRCVNPAATVLGAMHHNKPAKNEFGFSQAYLCRSSLEIIVQLRLLG